MNVVGVNQNIPFCGLKKGQDSSGSEVVQKENCDSEDSCHRSTIFDKGSSRKVALALAAVAGLSVGSNAGKDIARETSLPATPESSYVVTIDTAGTPFRLHERMYTPFEFPTVKSETSLENEDNQEPTIEAKEEVSEEAQTEESTTEANEEVSEEAQTEESTTEANEEVSEEAQSEEPITELETEGNQEETPVEITPQQMLENEYGIKIDGVIDEHNLGWHGDCYLPATLESLNACENGRKLIQDNITINEDSVSVHFPGINYTSEISFSELKEAKAHGRYSVGDDDILLHEVAIKDAFTKIKNGEIEAPQEIIDSINDSDDVLYSGYMQDVMFLYTGRLSWESLNPSLEIHDVSFNDRYDHDLDAALDFKMNNHDNVAMTLSMRSTSTTGAYHAYGVISVDKDSITIMNPIGSKPVTYSRQEIFDRIVDVEYCVIDSENA